MVNLCNICKKKVFSHLSNAHCKCCGALYHINCLNNSLNINDPQWLCHLCIEDIFPFSGLNDTEFQAGIYECNDNSRVSIIELQEKVFDAFQFNDHNVHLMDADPDINYFNDIAALSNLACCEYFTEDTFNTKHNQLIPDNNHLSIIHLNIRSAVKNLHEFNSYLNNLNHIFSFIGLTETWFTVNNVSYYNINNYNIENICRMYAKGGGVSLLIKEDIPYCTRNDLNVNDIYFQAIYVDIDKDIFVSENNIIIGVLYRPPNTDVHIFNEKLSSILHKIQPEKKILYLMGDYNINLINENTHLHTSEFLDIMYGNSLFPLITKPTRISNTNATLIDNIFCNDIINNYKFLNGILFTDISDHFPIFTIKITPVNINSNLPIKIRDLSLHNIQTFKEKLSLINWNSVYNCNDTNLAFSIFYKVFCGIYYECFPIKLIKSQYKKRKLWLSTGLKLSIKHKNKLYLRAKRSPSSHNIKNYKTYKNNLNRLMRIAEREHFNKILNDNRTNLKKSWKIIKEVVNRSNNKTTTYKFNIGRKLISDPNVIANSFNNFFSNIGKNLALKIPMSHNDPLKYMQNSNKNSIFINNAECEEVINIIKLLKPSTTGPDGINSNIIKNSYDYFINPLVHILNLSINQGIFPDELKLANITPIYKTGDNSLINNYRPISILSVFSKVFEKIMYNRIIKFVNKNKILYECQFGFRESYGTSLALIYLVDKLCQALNNSDFILGVCIDLSKAFDTVDHSILLRKLYYYGIRGVAYNWLKSYLSERKQCVNFENTFSNTCNISCGVPQGSILGPILFLLYVNDLALVSKVLFLIMFADDTNLFLTGKNINDLINIMNNELAKIKEWMNANKLSLNVTKTQYMVITGFKKMPNICNDILIDGTKIAMVHSVKFLGVIIDSRLTWSDHITYIKSKMSKSIGLLCKARKKLGKETLLTLYHSFISPYLLYGIEIWGNTHDKYLNSLYRLQKKSLRIIKGVSYKESSSPIFKEFNILKISQLYNVNIALFMYKFCKGKLPNVFADMYKFNAETHNYRLREPFKLKPPLCRLEICKKQVRSTGVKIWNHITRIIETNCSLHTFCKLIKLYFLNNDFTI